MQFWILSTIFLVNCAIEANSIQCFECTGDECNSINDSMLTNCEPQDTTASPTTTPSSSSSPTENTQTTNTPSATTSRGTTRTTTWTTSQSTRDDTTKTTTAAESTSRSTTSTSDDTTESTTTTTTTTTTSLPTETTIATEETSPPPTQVQNTLVQSKRQRRSLATNVKIPPADVLLANYRSRSHNGRADSNYYCYSATIPDGDSSKQKLGCVKVAADQEPCDVVRDLNNIPTNSDTNYSCQSCQTDKCNNNGAGHFQGISMLTLLAVLIVQKFCK